MESDCFADIIMLVSIFSSSTQSLPIERYSFSVRKSVTFYFPFSTFHYKTFPEATISEARMSAGIGGYRRGYFITERAGCQRGKE